MLNDPSIRRQDYPPPPENNLHGSRRKVARIFHMDLIIELDYFSMLIRFYSLNTQLNQHLTDERLV
jgi:hypothetical protein